MTDINPVRQGTNPIVTRSSKPVPSEEKKSVDEAKTSNTKAPVEDASNKIQKWFSQAGISTSKYSKFDEDIRKKLARRNQVKASRKLSNLENIFEKALEFCIEEEQEDNIDPDWFFSFVEMAEHVYSATMQEIWGKIFAVEVSKPGSFSLRTLSTLKNLTQRDAKIFQIAVGLACRKKGEYSPKLVFGYYQKPSFFALLGMQQNHQLNLSEFGLAYPDLLTLMDAGLIFSSEIESGELNPNKKTEWRCGNEVFYMAPKRSGIALNYYKFTPTGSELCKLVSSLSNSHYLQTLKAILGSGFEVT